MLRLPGLALFSYRSAIAVAAIAQPQKQACHFRNLTQFQQAI
jgi:hypothetical protein